MPAKRRHSDRTLGGKPGRSGCGQWPHADRQHSHTTESRVGTGRRKLAAPADSCSVDLTEYAADAFTLRGAMESATSVMSPAEQLDSDCRGDTVVRTAAGLC